MGKGDELFMLGCLLRIIPGRKLLRRKTIIKFILFILDTGRNRIEYIQQNINLNM